MLSCVILFCDKDSKYIPNLIKNINENLKLKHEIILIDSRNNHDKVLSFDGCKVYSKGKNIRQVEGRRWASEIVNGDYIWFIDADDSIEYVSEDLQKYMDESFDIISFKYRDLKADLMKSIHMTVDTDEDIIKAPFKRDYNILEKIGRINWNKWYKTDVFKKVCSLIPVDTEASMFEDNMFVALMLKFSKSIKILSETLYCYNTPAAISMKTRVQNFYAFELSCKGWNIVRDIINKNLSFEEKYNLKLEDFENFILIWFLERFYWSSHSMKKKLKHFLLDNFDEMELMTNITNLNNWKHLHARERYKMLRDLFEDNYQLDMAQN